MLSSWIDDILSRPVGVVSKSLLQLCSSAPGSLPQMFLHRVRQHRLPFLDYA